MNHTLRMTPAMTRFISQTEAEYYEAIQQPAPVPTHDNDAFWMEECRKRAVTMYGEFKLSQKKQSKFWGAIPGNSTAKKDAEYVDRFSSLLREHGDFDKALAIFVAAVRR